MLISNTKKFIFLKTKKCASTSVELYFQKYCVPEDHIFFSTTPARSQTPTIISEAGVVAYRGASSTNQELYHHMSAAKVKEHFPAEFDSFFKFSIMRNPFSKVVSLFWHRHREDVALSKADFSTVRDTFNQWIAKNGVGPRDRYIYEIDGEYVVDYFIMYEDLLEGVKSVCEKVNVPFEQDNLGSFKSGYHGQVKPYQDYFDDNSKAAVEAYFSKEIEKFSYSFD
ncbi:MAG: sulfotransferase family 2 domain-containing protein [Oceanicaulis sp.]|nr:sulfotransferase family 2 domain-containing protein [Oceanicaulis sp.]